MELMKLMKTHQPRCRKTSGCEALWLDKCWWNAPWELEFVSSCPGLLLVYLLVMWHSPRQSCVTPPSPPTHCNRCPTSHVVIVAPWCPHIWSNISSIWCCCHTRVNCPAPKTIMEVWMEPCIWKVVAPLLSVSFVSAKDTWSVSSHLPALLLFPLLTRELCDLWPFREVWHRPQESAARRGQKLPEPSTQHLHPLPLALPGPTQVGAQNWDCDLLTLRGNWVHVVSVVMVIICSCSVVGRGQVEHRLLSPSPLESQRRVTSATQRYADAAETHLAH